MSPAPRIRQVAACIIFVCGSICVRAAESGQAARPAMAAQPTHAVEAAPATQPAQTPIPQRALPAAQTRPATPVQLAPNASAQIAHSALLTVDGIATADTLQLQIRRVGDNSLVSSDDVTVTVDGKREPVSRGAGGGGYELPLDALRGVGHDVGRDVEVVVAHDGIREILAGKVALTDAGPVANAWRDHKQIAWWILNIVIVLIAAIAISRRKS